MGSVVNTRINGLKKKKNIDEEVVAYRTQRVLQNMLDFY